MKRAWKNATLVSGVLGIATGLMLLPLGLAWLALVYDDLSYGGLDGMYFGMVWIALLGFCLGGGFSLAYHATRSLQNKPSRRLRLPPLWVFAWGLPTLLVIGEALRRTATGGLFFPPLYLLAGSLPPLAALAWANQASSIELNWRQSVLAFVLGATLSVGLALILEMLLPLVFFGLVEGLFYLAQETWRSLLNELAGGRAAQALSSYAYLFAMIEAALIAPLAEEFAKPLFILPILQQVKTPQRAFLIGAAAGAGFASLENLLFTGFGFSQWGGVLAVRALGAAIHPLASGLVALGWYWFFNPTYKATTQARSDPHIRPYGWLPLFVAAVGLHALWNGGSVSLLALAGANFFGHPPPKVDMLGVTLAGVVLALLAVLGAAAWMGLRVAVRSLSAWVEDGDGSKISSPLSFDIFPTNRAIALWALLCLIFSLPLGLVALRLLGGAP